MSNRNTEKNNHWSKGFSLVEMLIVIPIVIIMIGVFVTAIVTMTGDVLSTRATNALAYNIQDALSRIKNDVKLSGAFLATNDIILTSPQGYNNDTTNFDNANSDPEIGQILILKTYATTSNPLSSTQNVMYLSGQPNACGSPIVSQNTPLMLNTIYFIKNSTLWRRVVAPSYYTTVGCIGSSVGIPWQQPSCAIDITGTMCKAQDERLVDNIQTSGFNISYYTTNNSTTANAIATDGSQSDTARQAALSESSTVSVTINGTDTVAGRDISQTATIREISPNNVAPTPSIVTNGLVVNLDAGNTASYPGSGTTWTDLSGNNNNGTLVNGVGFSSTNGGVLTFDGINDYLNLPTTGFASSSFSAELLAKFNANGGYVWVIADASGGNPELRMSVGSGLNVRLYDSSKYLVNTDAVAPITLSNWYDIGITITNNDYRIYVNGVLAAAFTGTVYDGGVAATHTLGTYVLYGTTPGYGGYVNMSLASYKYYNRVLSASEIQQNFNVLRVRYGI